MFRTCCDVPGKSIEKFATIPAYDRTELPTLLPALKNMNYRNLPTPTNQFVKLYCRVYKTSSVKSSFGDEVTFSLCRKPEYLPRTDTLTKQSYLKNPLATEYGLCSSRDLYH